MELVKAIVIKFYEINEKMFACIMDVKPKNIKYHIMAESVKSFDWLNMESWFVIEHKLNECFGKESRWQGSYMKKIFNLKNNITLSVKHRPKHFKDFYKSFCYFNKPKGYKIEYILECIIEYDDIYESGVLPHTSEKGIFKGFDENIDTLTDMANFEVENGLDFNTISPNSKNKNKPAPDHNEGSSESYSSNNVLDTESRSRSKTPRKTRKKRTEVEKLADALTKDNLNLGKRETRIPTFIKNGTYMISPEEPTKKRPKSVTEEEYLSKRFETLITKRKKTKPDELISHNNADNEQRQKVNSTCNTPEKPLRIKSIFGNEKTPRPQSVNQMFSDIEKKSACPSYSGNSQKKSRIESYMDEMCGGPDPSALLPLLNEPQRENHNSVEKIENVETSSDIYPTSEELAEQRKKDKEKVEESQKIKTFIEEMTGPLPTPKEHLTLQDVPVEELIATFEEHKEALDAIFRREKNKDFVKSYKGASHYLVMSLTDADIQMQLMEKLSEIYEAQLGRSSAFATLFANALMPEWLLRIFMKRFNMGREEAIHHLRAEEDYRVYLESLKEQSFNINNMS